MPAACRAFGTYTTDELALRLSELRAGADGKVAAATERVLLELPQEGDVHFGGHLAFGPDGRLYVGLGDGYNPANAQDLTSLRGKILRLDMDGAEPYGIPVDNPPAGRGGGLREEVWAWDSVTPGSSASALRRAPCGSGTWERSGSRRSTW